MNLLKSSLVMILAASAAGLGCSAGCHDPHWMTSSAIQGNDGSSYETALRVGARSYPVNPETPVSSNEEQWLTRQEYEWIHGKYCRDLGISSNPEGLERIMHRTTEQRGTPVKRIYDVVTLTVPGALTNVTYFDVARFRYVRPHSY